MTAPQFPFNYVENAARQSPEATVLAHGLEAIHNAITWSARLQATAVLRAAGYYDPADVVAELVEVTP